MKILKYFIKPLELLAFLCLLAALVYFRSNIFHSNVNQYIDKALVYVEEQLEIEIPSHINEDVALKPVVEAECEQTKIEVVSNDEVIESDEVEKLDSSDKDAESGSQLALIETLSEAINAINGKVDSLFDMSKSEPVVETGLDSNESKPASEGEKQSNVASSEVVAEVPVSTSSSVDTRQVLYDARKLFWSRNLQDSEKLYLEAVSIDNVDPDAYGELGNVYYAQGKWKLAGEAYYEAAVRLLAQKNSDQTSDRVHYLLRVIQGLDVTSAEKLKNKISG